MAMNILILWVRSRSVGFFCSVCMIIDYDSFSDADTQFIRLPEVIVYPTPIIRESISPSCDLLILPWESRSALYDCNTYKWSVRG